jgi:hypothetical protein
MPVAVDTKNRSRGRRRPGRKVSYTPTAAEVALYGAGPYPGEIAEVNANGTVDITVTFPALAAGYGTLDGAYGAPELAALNDATTARRLQNVLIGGLAGQCALFGPAAA